MKTLTLLLSAALLLSPAACGTPADAEATTEAIADTTTETPAETPTETPAEPQPAEQEEANTMTLQIGEQTFPVTMEENEAADALLEQLEIAPLEITLQEYGGFEKVGTLGLSLPTADRRTTTQSGDIVLYNGNQIVLFYGSNTWSYTRLGHVDDLNGWADALAGSSVSVTLSR